MDMHGAFKIATGQSVANTPELRASDAVSREERRIVAARWVVAHPGERPTIRWVVVTPHEVLTEAERMAA
jgi:hypothetical protein